MHNLDWSQFTFLDHLIACVSLALIVVVPAALITAPFWISAIRKGGR